MTSQIIGISGLLHGEIFSNVSMKFFIKDDDKDNLIIICLRVFLKWYTKKETGAF